MDLKRLYELLQETTAQYRKGPVLLVDGQEATEEQKRAIAEDKLGGGVVEVFAMPHVDDAPEGVELVDCHFVVIGVDRALAESHRKEFVELIRMYPQPDRLRGGPSFIEVGAEVGDQGRALQLFALGQVLGLWKVITPATLHISGPEADRLAGSGLVMISGWKDAPVVKVDG